MTSIRRRRALSIRTRVLTLALVPSLVFLIAGAFGAGYLIFDAARTKNYFQLASSAQDEALPLIVSLQDERRLTLRKLASFGTFQSDLDKRRAATDALAGKATAALGDLSADAPDSVNRAIREFGALMGELPTMRARVDGEQVGIGEAADLYNGIIDQFVAGQKGLAQFAPDAEIAYRQGIVAPLLEAVDLMQRSDAFAAAYLVGGGLSRDEFNVYQGQVASYHQALDKTIPLTEPEVQQAYRTLTGSPAWLRLMQVEKALVGGATEIPISEDLWRGAAGDVSLTLAGMLQRQNDSTNGLALDRVNSTLTESILAGIGVLIVVGAVFVFALRLSRRLIERLVRLRTETLDLAENRLPLLVEGVRTGADVRPDEVRLGEYGGDEIGEVANAFNKAQQTAVASAVQEAKTREGTNKVFLNIAHRSQVIVHRQLKTLDEAERKQEDPEQLELLFQLDHLTTRQRRNAENLIILGGGQPGRKWRNPVSLTEVARGAAAETEDFSRVKIAKLPPRKVIGPVVGDLVHLLAELIDNAATFSPPGSRVEVRGNVVGRGVVLEIEDQGLGIEADRVDELNMMLANPPDFGIMALSAEPRLGLFVVARLAARHGVAVSLRDSAYGGTRAIVLVRNELLGPDTEVPGMPDVGTAPAEAAEPKPQVNGQHGPNPSIKLSVPGAVSLPNLPPLPVVEARPGEDLFRPQRPAEGENKPSLPSRRPRKPEQADERPELPKRSKAGQEPARPHPDATEHHTQPHEPVTAAQPEATQPWQQAQPEATQQWQQDQAPAQPETQQPWQQDQPEAQQAWPQDQPEAPQPRHQVQPPVQAEAQPWQDQSAQPEPRHQAQPQAQAPAQPQAASPAQPEGQSPQFAQANGRPPLPQRRRQQNLAPQLQEAPPSWPQSQGDQEHNREDTPEQARSRLASFQSGTRRGRHAQVSDDTLTINDSVGSGRNGQHRSE
jgi:signal transduction histidine kinase